MLNIAPLPNFRNTFIHQKSPIHSVLICAFLPTLQKRNPTRKGNHGLAIIVIQSLTGRFYSTTQQVFGGSYRGTNKRAGNRQATYRLSQSRDRLIDNPTYICLGVAISYSDCCILPSPPPLGQVPGSQASHHSCLLSISTLYTLHSTK